MPTESTHVPPPRSPGATEDTHSPSSLGSVLTEPEHGEPPSCREPEPTHDLVAARFHPTISIVQTKVIHHQKNWTVNQRLVDAIFEAPRGLDGFARSFRRFGFERGVGVQGALGWAKTIGGGRQLRYRGRLRKRAWFKMTAAVYNMIRITALDTQQGSPDQCCPGPAIRPGGRQAKAKNDRRPPLAPSASDFHHPAELLPTHRRKTSPPSRGRSPDDTFAIRFVAPCS